MSKCIFCNKQIPKDRVNNSNKKVIYCSKECIKKAWYVKNKTNKCSYYLDKKEWSKSETGKGWKWEMFIAKLIKAKKMPFGYQYDLLCGKDKIDVKSANLYKRIRNPKWKPAYWWRFDRGEFIKDIDFFFCVCLIDNVPKKIYKIPNNNFGKRGITIGKTTSIYDKYLFPFVI
jgi:hypothetical protein